MYIDSKKRNFEFDAELEDHKIDDKDLYRLYFMEFNRIGLPYNSKANIEVVDYPYKPFKLPSGMTKEDVVQIYKKCNVEFYDLEKVSNAKTIGCKNNKKQKIL